MLTFAEELILLLHDEDGAPLPIQEDALACALAGAVLMDLAFAYRIDTDLQALVVTDQAPTGDAVLDRLLAKIAARLEAADTRTWIRELSVDEAAAIQEEVLSGLVERGVLTPQVGNFPWTLQAPRHPMVDDEAAGGVSRRIQAVLHSDDIPDPRDIALIALLDACDLLADIFPAQEMEQCRARIEQLRQMDLIGRELAGAIADIEHRIIAVLRARSARFRRLLLHLSVGGGLGAAAALLVPRIPVPGRFGPSLLQSLWFDELWQQWSGYLLLGFSGLGLLAILLLRARTVARLGGGHWWRLAHVGFGLGCVLLLFAHTGLRLGANLNAALMACYLAALAFGALAGIATNGAPQLRGMGATPKLRTVLMRLHRGALYPLPALLAIHVLIVYLY